jgi:epoxyqueuosine reductase
MLVSSVIKAEAERLGFFGCGISKACRVSPEKERDYSEWLRSGCNATMDYLCRNVEKRLDPRLLVPGVRSIVSVALNYKPVKDIPDGELKLASYSLGADYHFVVKGKLRQLAEALGVQEYRAFCDSAPVFERYWAVQAGLGWIGRNGQLVIPHAGSMFFLGELFVMDDADEYDSPCENRCGTCHKCVDACPTGCLGHVHFEAEKCLSYQTIENRGDLSELAKDRIGDTFYGCDECIKACPWNRFAVPTDVEEFRPRDELLQMTRQDWQNLTEEQYRRLFKGSAVKRAKYECLKRNISAALAKSADASEERGE